ncbi:MAG TPA: PRC-barrel domain-containing protein [Blastocatellia bacterium]|nr:PRC-barrel domain-containing protein [Blastocatellia bacterium]
MLRSAKKLIGIPVQALDGPIGSVLDLYFDDRLWRIRYLVVDTGQLLPGRKVLISPSAAGVVSRGARVLPVLLTRRQVIGCPEIYADPPVSRQQERVRAEWDGWSEISSDRSGPVGSSVTGGCPPMDRSMRLKTDENFDSHLRSAGEVTGYCLLASDGQVGRVEDLLIGDGLRTVRYLIASLENRLPEKTVLVAPVWVDEICWNGKRVEVALPGGIIRECPNYGSQRPLNLQS